MEGQMDIYDFFPERRPVPEGFMNPPVDEVYEETKNEHIPIKEVIREIHDGVYREGYEDAVDDFIDFVFQKSSSCVDIRTDQDLHEYLNYMSVEFLKEKKQ